MMYNNEKKLRTRCPGCGRDNSNNQRVFKRDFSHCDEIVAFKQYDVFLCGACNLVYAGNIEESMPIDVYYEKMSRYEGDNFVISPKLEKHYRFVVDAITPNLDMNASILDIGCAFGGLLYEFKKRGYDSVFGLEPSIKNCDYAMKKYGIKVYQGSLV